MLDLSWTLSWGHLHDRPDPSVFATFEICSTDFFLRWFGVNSVLSFIVRLVLWSKGWQASRLQLSSFLMLWFFFWESFLCFFYRASRLLSFSCAILCWHLLAVSRSGSSQLEPWACSRQRSDKESQLSCVMYDVFLQFLLSHFWYVQIGTRQLQTLYIGLRSA